MHALRRAAFRRSAAFSRSAALLSFASLFAFTADAGAQQKYPVRPIRFVVSTTPGSTPDLLARLIGPKLSEAWGQPVVIENRPGASGTIAATMVAKAACATSRPSRT